MSSHEKEGWEMGLTVQCSIKGIKVAWLYAMQKGLGSQDNIKENVCTT